MRAHSNGIRLLRYAAVGDVAECCRNAALDFVHGVPHGWGKQELANWLTHDYHPLAMLRFSREELSRMPPSATYPHAKVLGPVREPDVVKVMWEAREIALGVIHRFQFGGPGEETFLWRVQSIGALARVQDQSSLRGLVPNDLARQRLSDRVLSLLACDYVSRPLDYQDHVTVCRKCCSITFRPGAREDRVCGAHPLPDGHHGKHAIDQMRAGVRHAPRRAAPADATRFA